MCSSSILKEHRYQQDPEPKYYFQTNDGPAEAIRVLNTCLSVMLYLLRRDPLASGGFISTPKPEEGENATNGQRFRIYSQLAATFSHPNARSISTAQKPMRIFCSTKPR
jgi:hypothetical protein